MKRIVMMSKPTMSDWRAWVKLKSLQRRCGDGAVRPSSHHLENRAKLSSHLTSCKLSVCAAKIATGFQDLAKAKNLANSR
jgi:hypothetical protein